MSLFTYMRILMVTLKNSLLPTQNTIKNLINCLIVFYSNFLSYNLFRLLFYFIIVYSKIFQNWDYSVHYKIKRDNNLVKWQFSEHSPNYWGKKSKTIQGSWYDKGYLDILAFDDNYRNKRYFILFIIFTCHSNSSHFYLFI